MTPQDYILSLFQPNETIAVVLIHPQLGTRQRIVPAQTAASPGFQQYLKDANTNGRTYIAG